MGGVVRQLEDQRTIDVSLHDQDRHENQEQDDSIINDQAGHFYVQAHMYPCHEQWRVRDTTLDKREDSIDT